MIAQILLAMSLAVAGPSVELKFARKTWKAFQSCAKQKQEKDLLSCAGAELSEKLDITVKLQLIRLLDQGFFFLMCGIAKIMRQCSPWLS